MTPSDASAQAHRSHVEDLLQDWFADLRRGQCRVWSGPQRTHTQVRAPAPGSEAESLFAEAVRGLFASQPEIDWARYNASVGRVVIDTGSGGCDQQALLRRIEELEQRLGLLDEPFGAAGGSERDHPADREPLLREGLELALELVGAGVGLALLGTSSGQPLGIDLAALLRFIETAPGLRVSVDRVLGPSARALLLSFGTGVDHALLRGVSGPLVVLLERVLRLRTRLGNRQRWQALEGRLSANPAHHPEQREPIGERPCPLPQGPIERYVERAAILSLGAFGFGLTVTGDREGSAAALLAALPRPALLGRTGFSLELGRRLIEVGALLLDPEVLARLDRIDCVLIDRALLTSVWGAALLTAAKEAGLLLVVVAEPQEEVPAQADRRCPAGEASLPYLRRLQAEGWGVMVVAANGLPALAGADLAVGVLQDEGPPPWGADLIVGPELEPLWLLLEACPAARTCATQSVQAALIEVVVGLALCLDGVQRRSALAVNQSSHLLAGFAMANGLRLARACQGQPPEPPADTIPWHALEVEEVLRRVRGPAAAASPHGPAGPGAHNQLPNAAGGPDWLTLLFAELNNPLVPVLVTGAGLSALLASPVDAGLILAVLAGNAAIGAVQRLRVERALAALQERHAAPVWVRREQELCRIHASELRHGDVIRLEAGEVVPADCRILSASGLQVDEAVLSGESFPVVKGPEPSAAAALAERSSMLYAGTTVVAGTAEAVAIALGDATEARRGLNAVRGAAMAGGVEGRLESLTNLTTPIATISGVAVLLSALAHGRDPRVAVAEGVALTVAAVPEGLPVLASLAQLAAASRLSREHVLVRNPRAIESLGRINAICLDKTGTLTSGRIRLVQICADKRCMAPEQLDAAGHRVLRLALRATPEPEAGKRLAHPTDQGLLEGARVAGVERDSWQTLEVLPFEPSRGFHASVCTRGGELQLCVKGAPEVVLAASAFENTLSGSSLLEQADRDRLVEQACQLAERGLRVLAVARRRLAETPASPGSGQVCALSDADVRDLEFLGFVALEDPIRDTARQALADLRRAGVSASIITGDHPATAHAIARQLELPGDGTILTGPMLEEMDDASLQEAVLNTAVFARITAMQKLRIVRALRQAGRVVAMAGDGANDAAAIRLAEVGIALGSHATEAARAAADLVVTDGRIETIVLAVLEGRALWRSVRDAVGLLVGGNLGEIGFTLLSGLVEGRSPLNTRQLLLMNLLTDVAPALAIAMRPPLGLQPEQLLQEGPDASLGSPLEQDILRTAALTAISSALARSVAASGGDRRGADTVGLLTLVGTQLGQVLTRRQGDRVALLTGLGSFGALIATVQTPLVSQAFGCRPLGLLGLVQAGMATAVGTGMGVLLPRLPNWGAGPTTNRTPSPGRPSNG